MDINHLFAGVVVTNRGEAANWYELLLGKPPDFLPNDTEAVWQITDSSSFYIVADLDHAGHSIVALVVEDLDTTLAEIASTGITVGPIEQIQGAGRKSVITDPDGNTVSLIQILASS
jgi:hypothetical protein